MELEKLEKIKEALTRTQPLITEIEKMRNSRLVAFFCTRSITGPVAYRLNKIIRKIGCVENLDILVESSGGDIDSTAKIIKILRTYCKKLSVIIPFYAKSAAALFALHADETILCKSGELGPIDPIVEDPTTKVWIPAHSIKEAVNFIQETGDPLVKLSMADKLPPLLLGAYRDAQNATKQYLQEALSKIEDQEAREDCIHTFSEKFVSHGYPIDIEICKKAGLNVVCPEVSLEDKLHDLHEIYCDLMLDTLKTTELLIIQANTYKCVVVNDEDVSASL